jgi:hypothetical protein
MFVLSCFGFNVEAAVEVVKALLEIDLSEQAARYFRLGWFRDGSDDNILLCDNFEGLVY